MVTLPHHIRITADGFNCTCNRNETLGENAPRHEKLALAVRHQFAVVMIRSNHGDEIATTCFDCNGELRIQVNGSDRMASYHTWLHAPCAGCGMAPIDAVAKR